MLLLPKCRSTKRRGFSRNFEPFEAAVDDDDDALEEDDFRGDILMKREIMIR